MRFSQYLRLILRDSRGARGRLLFFVACLAVGVAAVTAVAGLMRSMDEGIRIEARRLLGADVSVEGRRELPAQLADVLTQFTAQTGHAVARTNIVEVVTLVAAGPRAAPNAEQNQSSAATMLVELKSPDGPYPYYGKLALTPDRPLSEALANSGVVVAPELLARLHLKLGDSLTIGNSTFQITGLVDSEPDRLNFSFALGPRVFLSRQSLDQTGLVTRGSRLRYSALLQLDGLDRPESSGGATAKDAEALAQSIRDRLTDASYFNVESFSQAQPALRAGLRRMGNYLGLVGLLSLLIGGVGVAQTIRAYVAARLDSIAILKCLGVTPSQAVAVYLGQVLLLALAGSLVGVALGAAIQAAVPRVAPELVPPELVHAWQPAALLRGLLMGVGVAMVFSVPPLLDVRRVPPVRLLRTDSQPLPLGRWANWSAAAVLIFAVFVAASVQGGSSRYGLFFTLGLIVVIAILVGAAALVIKSVARLPRDRGPLWLRHGLASLARPGAATVSAIVALGLGVAIITAMQLVQSRLATELSGELPGNAPTSFFVDIQPDQHAPLQKLLEQQHAKSFDSVPVVMGRLQRVDGTPIEQLAAAIDENNSENRNKKWVLTREQRMTYSASLAKGNTITSGPTDRLWSDPAHAEVSIEQKFASDLNVRVGSTLTLDVQGVPIELKVTTIRNVDWRTFGINFFLVVEPGVLDDAPQLRLATARLPAGSEQHVQDAIVASFPNITVVHIREVLTKVLRILERLGLAVQLLGAFTVVSGIVILAGVISASYARRGREVALLKTLGMTRGQVVLRMAVEYALIGAVAGAIGIAAGTTLAWAILTRVMELPFTLPLATLAAIVIGAVIAAVTAGLAVSVRALRMRPIAVLREG